MSAVLFSARRTFFFSSSKSPSSLLAIPASSAVLPFSRRRACSRSSVPRSGGIGEGDLGIAPAKERNGEDGGGGDAGPVEEGGWEGEGAGAGAGAGEDARTNPEGARAGDLTAVVVVVVAVACGDHGVDFT